MAGRVQFSDFFELLPSHYEFPELLSPGVVKVVEPLKWVLVLALVVHVVLKVLNRRLERKVRWWKTALLLRREEQRQVLSSVSCMLVDITDKLDATKKHCDGCGNDIIHFRAPEEEPEMVEAESQTDPRIIMGRPPLWTPRLKVPPVRPRAESQRMASQRLLQREHHHQERRLEKVGKRMSLRRCRQPSDIIKRRLKRQCDVRLCGQVRPRDDHLRWLPRLAHAPDGTTEERPPSEVAMSASTESLSGSCKEQPSSPAPVPCGQMDDPRSFVVPARDTEEEPSRAFQTDYGQDDPDQKYEIDNMDTVDNAAGGDEQNEYTPRDSYEKVNVEAEGETNHDMYQTDAEYDYQMMNQSDNLVDHPTSHRTTNPATQTGHVAVTQHNTDERTVTLQAEARAIAREKSGLHDLIPADAGSRRAPSISSRCSAGSGTKQEPAPRARSPVCHVRIRVPGSSTASREPALAPHLDCRRKPVAAVDVAVVGRSVAAPQVVKQSCGGGKGGCVKRNEVVGQENQSSAKGTSTTGHVEFSSAIPRLRSSRSKSKHRRYRIRKAIANEPMTSSSQMNTRGQFGVDSWKMKHIQHSLQHIDRIRNARTQSRSNYVYESSLTQSASDGLRQRLKNDASIRRPGSADTFTTDTLDSSDGYREESLRSYSMEDFTPTDENVDDQQYRHKENDDAYIFEDETEYVKEIENTEKGWPKSGRQQNELGLDSRYVPELPEILCMEGCETTASGSELKPSGKPTKLAVLAMQRATATATAATPGAKDYVSKLKVGPTKILRKESC